MERATADVGAVARADRSTPRPVAPLAAAGHRPAVTRGRIDPVKEASAHRFYNSTLDCYAVRHPKLDAAPGV
ncbi:hypothetical protein BE11_32925 [Sorangium cellulosum]|nr:hypothetical protein BE11_32925 [Sorangium cellulosum]